MVAQTNIESKSTPEAVSEYMKMVPFSSLDFWEPNGALAGRPRKIQRMDIFRAEQAEVIHTIARHLELTEEFAPEALR